jgi:hypothetical protein
MRYSKKFMEDCSAGTTLEQFSVPVPRALKTKNKNRELRTENCFMKPNGSTLLLELESWWDVLISKCFVGGPAKPGCQRMSS